MDEMADPPELDGPPAGVSAPAPSPQPARVDPAAAAPRHHPLRPPRLRRVRPHPELPALQGALLAEPAGPGQFVWLLAGFALEAEPSSPTAASPSRCCRKTGPTFSKVLRIDLSTLAVSHVIPGGTAGGTGLGYRLLTSNGVSGADAGFALATQGIGSAVVLNAMLWVALVISIPLHGFNSAYVTVAVVGAVLLAAFAALVLAFTRGEAHATRALRLSQGACPWVTEEQMEKLVQRLANRLADARLGSAPASRGGLVGGRELALRRGLALGLRRRLRAHHRPIDLFVAYGVANVLAAVPLTPGGLGIVEAVAATSLDRLRRPRGHRLAGRDLLAPVQLLAARSRSAPAPTCRCGCRRGAGLKERRDALGGMTQGA